MTDKTAAQETPRTDASIAVFSGEAVIAKADLVRADFARQLERELNEAVAALRCVQDDLNTARETWNDSSAGPSTVPGEPRDAASLDISQETQEKIAALIKQYEANK